jgi:hypothetical protein
VRGFQTGPENDVLPQEAEETTAVLPGSPISTLQLLDGGVQIRVVRRRALAVADLLERLSPLERSPQQLSSRLYSVAAAVRILLRCSEAKKSSVYLDFHPSALAIRLATMAFRFDLGEHSVMCS